ncbi:hypothetical protein PFISCL1PPCAC_9781, partial [Pristionchus fissidentatus]
YPPLPNLNQTSTRVCSKYSSFLRYFLPSSQLSSDTVVIALEARQLHLNMILPSLLSKTATSLHHHISFLPNSTILPHTIDSMSHPYARHPNSSSDAPALHVLLSYWEPNE